MSLSKLFFVSLICIGSAQATYRVDFDEQGKPSLRQIITQDVQTQTDNLEPQDAQSFLRLHQSLEEEKKGSEKKSALFGTLAKLEIEKKTALSLMTSKVRSLWYGTLRDYCKEFSNDRAVGEYKLPSEEDFISFYYRKVNFDEIFEIFLNSNTNMSEDTKSSLFKFYDEYNTNFDFTPWNK